MPANPLINWLKLARLQAGAATAITCVFGAILLMPRNEIDYLHLFTLFLIGLLFHFYGFVLNEYSDIEVDRFAKELSHKPLIKGTINKKNALHAAMVAALLVILLPTIFFQKPLSILALLAALLLGAIYDLFGKRFFGADLVLGMSIFFFTLFGALTVTSNITLGVVLVAFLFFIQLSFQTGVTGGVKDIPHDTMAGARTSPVALECKVEGKSLIITRGFKAYVIGTKAVHTVAIFLPFFIMNIIILYDPFYIQLMILIILIAAMWGLTLEVLKQKIFNRLKLMRLLGVQEVVTYPTVSILIMGEIGVSNALFLLFLPIVWLAVFLYIIYGKFMPDV